MEQEQFNELLRNLKLMKSADPENFRLERFINDNDLTNDQKTRIRRDLGEEVDPENVSYTYFENDYF